MAKTRKIIERVTAPFTGSQVDREAGVIRNALICGWESANGRDYTRESFGDGSQYCGRPVYANHSTGNRRIEDKVGWFGESVTFDAQGRPRGDFHVLKSHPLVNAILEAAERNPALFGFSHVAICQTRPGANGREQVESVRSVESVDIVAEPATTNGFFEGKTVAVKLKEYLNKLAPKCGLKQIGRARRLAEDDGFSDLDMPGDAPAPEADDTSADDGISAAFKAAIMSVVEAAISGDMDPGEALKKIKTLLSSHGDATDAGGSDTSGSDDTSDEDDSDTQEGKRKKPDDAKAIREAIEVARKVGLKGFDTDDLEIIAAAPANRREAVAKKLASAASGGGETPASAGRHRFQESKQSGGSTTAPTDAKSFVSSIRE